MFQDVKEEKKNLTINFTIETCEAKVLETIKFIQEKLIIDITYNSMINNV